MRAEEGIEPDMDYLERLGLAERWEVWKDLTLQAAPSR
jgi:hypothetical protein